MGSLTGDFSARLSVVVPIYNEAATLRALYERLSQVLASLPTEAEIIFVDDGSRDESVIILHELALHDPRITVLQFSRNFGHQAALSAGLDAAGGDAVVTMDGDLQDPPELIPKMLDLWMAGSDVVLAERTGRPGETWFKRATASAFYRLLRRMTDVDIPVDVGDFRLLDREVVEVLRRCPERNRFLRGLVAWAGFKQAKVSYRRSERFAGDTKYTIRKMMRLAVDGLTGFSDVPLRLATWLGIGCWIASLVGIAVVVLERIVLKTVPGWASVMVIVLFLGGVQLLTLGLLGEYISRIYDEARGRPLYVVQRGLTDSRRRIASTTAGSLPGPMDRREMGGAVSGRSAMGEDQARGVHRA